MPSPSTSTAPPRPDGLVLAPFRALRYDASRADLAAVTSPPYDVIDAEGLEELEQASDVNVVRLILPRDERSEGDRYARAAATLRDWRARGVLRPDDAHALYVYEQSSGSHVQRGLLGALALSPAEDGIVLPHENTMANTVSDRLALYTAVEADLEPIFLLLSGGGAAAEVVRAVDARHPVSDVVLADGLRHRLWAITEPAELRAVAEDLAPRTAVIADGHHRYATYLQRQAQAHADGRGAGPWDYGLTFLVDPSAFGPEVHPIHRVVPGHDVGELAARAAAVGSVSDLDGDSVEEALAALAGAGRRGPAFLLASPDASVLRVVSDLDAERVERSLPAERSPAWRRLDVSVLHAFLMAEVWALTDDEAPAGYAHDVAEALSRAGATHGTAVLLNPTPAEAVAAVAAAGERMPRKSTLFTPKPRTGFVIRDHHDS
jgi:uncharacterized protein (DUF1015 family)